MAGRGFSPEAGFAGKWECKCKDTDEVSASDPGIEGKALEKRERPPLGTSREGCCSILG